MLIAISIGVAIGLAHGTLVAYAKIPAFIVTLGGLLAWRGAIKGISHSETIPIGDPSFRALGQSYVDPRMGWAIAILAVAAVLFVAYRRIRANRTFIVENANSTGVILSAIAQAAAIVGFIFVMNSYAGVPIPVLIFLVVALIGVFITNFTTFGRYLYAIGGNPDAARLSGINNESKILQVYALLGALTGVAALIYTARVGSASPDAGVLKELDAIAACVIGGASLMGGRGTIFGACLGALIMASLDNGMSLLNVSDFMQDIIKGSILVAAVGLDMLGRKQS
jgi:D-xylose transport system permease protein